MSSIDKAKKQAKRLFDLTKTKSPNKEELSLPLPNLNSAYEAISKMNGFQNWHDYRLNLERSDMLSHKLNKSDARKKEKALLENKDYFLQDIPLTTVNRRLTPKTISYTEKDHAPIIIGHNGNSGTKEDRGWLLSQYPFYIQGDRQTEKVRTLLSFSDEYLKNNEGLIYLDVEGQTQLYGKLFTLAHKIDRVQDLYAFHLHSKEDKAKGSTTHTLDPINPMSQYPDYFEIVFGKEIGSVIHSILKTVHAEDKLLTVHSLPAFLMLNNIISWNDKGLPAVEKYLKQIGYKNGITDNVIERHMIFCEQAYTVINQLIEFEHCFSHEPNIDLMKIFKERKVLLMVIDNTFRYNTKDTIGPLKCLYQGILCTDKYLSMAGYGHCQNIIFDNCSQYLNEEKEISNISIIKESKNNYILSNYSLHHEAKNMSSLIEVSKTFASMKIDVGKVSIPLCVKFDAMNNMPNLPPIFYANENIKKGGYDKYHLHSMKEGEMYVFSNSHHVVEDKSIINNSHQYYIEKITAISHNQSIEGSVYLYKHDC